MASFNFADFEAGTLEHMLFDLPFALMGLYMLVGRFFVDARHRACTLYAVTDQRVSIIWDAWGRRVTSVPLRTLQHVTLSERRGGSGDIVLGSVEAFAPADQRRRRPASPTLEALDDARQRLAKVNAGVEAVEQRFRRTLPRSTSTAGYGWSQGVDALRRSAAGAGKLLQR